MHWYMTDRCNLNCSYCFKPKFPDNENEGKNIDLAHILADSDVRKVTIGGGEPTLAGNLAEAVRILKKGGKYVSLHTNGVSLDKAAIAELDVDDIALPIDSADRDTQIRLRGEGFLAAFDRIPHLASSISRKGIALGYHTVFTAINYSDIPAIYKMIKRKGFDYWRIYEFNEHLAISAAFDAGASQKGLGKRLAKIKRLMDNGTQAKGYTDSLLAKFLLAEQEMKKYNDSRVQFVGRRDAPEPYAFMDNSGDVSYYTWLSRKERRVIGNIMRDGYRTIRKRLQEVHEKDREFDDKTYDEEWWADVGDMPLWARLWDGSYFPQEIEKIKPKFWGAVKELSELHTRRRAEHDALWL